MDVTNRMLFSYLVALLLSACGPAGGELATRDAGHHAAAGNGKGGAVNDTSKPTVPKSTSGQDVVGEALPLEAMRWITGEAPDPEDLPKATLVRWWTNSCPYCEASLPVIASLQREFGVRGLATRAVYHPKPPREVADETIIAMARERGFDGPVGVDPDWGFLREHYLEKGRRHATSVAFLLDDEGDIRFVHGGPVIGSSDAFRGPETEDEYERLRQAIQALVGEAGVKGAAGR